MAQRSYRWLLVTLAVIGLAADQASKYGMFRVLYDGTFRSEREVVPGWFKFTTEFDPTVSPCDCSWKVLQTYSAPIMPRVNQGALFGLGNEHKELSNYVFAGISFFAAAGIILWATRRATAVERRAALGIIPRVRARTTTAERRRPTPGQRQVSCPRQCFRCQDQLCRSPPKGTPCLSP